jgi:Pyridoxamine 5'-phosphate oxidase
MASWAEFERAAPELAAIGRERIERHGFMLLGTVRRDGTARISAVGVRLLSGELTMSIVRDSTKERDLRRDPRCLLHSPMLHGNDPNDELKLRGRVVRVEEPELRQAAALWTPPPELDVFSLDLESAAFLEWSKGEMTMLHWTSNRGVY